LSRACLGKMIGFSILISMALQKISIYAFFAPAFLEVHHDILGTHLYETILRFKF